MTMYEELLVALKDKDYEILSEKESAHIVNDIIEEKIAFTWYERIDFSKIKNKTVITDVNQLKDLFDRVVYLFWDYVGFPVIKTKLKNIFDCWDDASCLGTRTWIVSTEFDFFLEFYDELILGFRKE